MGDSGLMTFLGVLAISAVIVAVILAAVAWRVRNRTLRISIGSGLVILGLCCTVLSIAAFILVGGLGVAVIVLGVRTRQDDVGTHGTKN